MPKHWNIWRYDTFSCDILDPNAIPMLKYRPGKKLTGLAQLVVSMPLVELVEV